MTEKKLFEQRYNEIMSNVAQTVKTLLIKEGLDINPTIINNSLKLDEMARAAVKRTIDKKAYANVADAIRRHNYDIEWAKTVSPNPRWDDAELLHRYVSALMCLKQPCPQTEADIDKIGVFAEYAKTLIDDDHTGTIDDIITLFNEQDPIEARGNRVGTARAAKGWRKSATDTTTTAETPTSSQPVEQKPAVSKETEEVPASQFSFDDDDEEEVVTPVETPASVEEPENSEDDADDNDYPAFDDVEPDESAFDDDALDNDTEDGEDDENETDDFESDDNDDSDDDDPFGDDDMFDDAFGDDEPSRPVRRSVSNATVHDDALDNDSEDDTDEDNDFDDPFGDDTNDGFFSGDVEDETPAGRDDTVWGAEAAAEEEDETEEDEDPNRITNIDAVTIEQYNDPAMKESFHNFSPSKILLEDDKIGFEVGVRLDDEDEYTYFTIMRDTFAEALEDYRIIIDASIDANVGDSLFWLQEAPVVRTFRKAYSNAISDDDEKESELQDRSEEFAEKCFYKAKTALDVVDYINNEFNAGK